MREADWRWRRGDVELGRAGNPVGGRGGDVHVPGETPVATPFALTLATVGALLDQLKPTPLIGWLAASKALAAKARVLPWTTIAVAGASVTLATSAVGGGSSASLQAPNVAGMGPAHTPAPSRCREEPVGSCPARARRYRRT